MWKYRDSSIKLFLSFANFNISGDEFTDRFLELELLHVNELNRLINELESSFEFELLTAFPFDSRAFGFTSILNLNQIFKDCDTFVSDELLESLDDLRITVEIN